MGGVGGVGGVAIGLDAIGPGTALFRPAGISPDAYPIPGVPTGPAWPLLFRGLRWPEDAAVDWQRLPDVGFRNSDWGADHWVVFMVAEFCTQQIPNAPALGRTTLGPPPAAPAAPPPPPPRRWDNVFDPSPTGADRPQTNMAPSTTVDDEFRELRSLVEYRAAVLDEALQQRWGILSYLRGVANFSPASHRNTFLLAYAAQLVGSMVSMYWKQRFARARPSRLDPALLPPIEVPSHPAYPSAHATESMLVALVLEQVLPAQIVQDRTGATNAENGPLRTMARRVARNREVLGVHYPSDTRCGFKLAARCLPLFLQCPSVRGASHTVDGNTLPAPPGEQAQAAVTLYQDLTTTITEPPASAPVTAGGTAIFNDGLLARARREWT